MMQPADLRNGDDAAEERELGLDARRAPQRILTGHAFDQPSDVGFDLRSADLAGSRLPPPDQFEALAMPSNYGVGLHNDQSGTPPRPEFRQRDPEDSITPAQARGFRLLLQNRELLSKREILRGEFGSMTKQGPNEKDDRAK